MNLICCDYGSKKVIDFDAEWERYFEHRGEMATVNVKHLAKYFFELGLKVAQKGD